MTSLGPYEWVTKKSKLWLALVVGTFGVVSYKFAGEVSMKLGPRTLPLSEIDHAIPVVPWTVWIYVSVYAIYFSSVFLQRDLSTFGRFLLSYVIGYGASMFFFIAFPTTLPREAFPVPDGSGISGAALEFFRATDRPTNCFPSMHVATCVVTTLPFWRRRPWVFAFFCLWTVAISVTTLTTKQHYLVDVLCGALFGLLCYAIAPKVQALLERGLVRPPGQSVPPSAG